MIPYYSPHLSFYKVILSFLSGNASKKIENYFTRLTGKKHILLTNSCRSALYLSYKSIKKKGKVITSPLTCNSALEPIKYSGNELNYVDIDKNTLNISISELQKTTIDNNTIALQAIHLGGIPCDMEKICKFAKEKRLFLVEDCAQGFGASLSGKSIGSWGEVSCFSLIKNIYGIGGGVLATNNYEIYLKAKEFQDDFPKIRLRLLIYRIVRNIIESNRRYYFSECLYRFFMKLRGEVKGEVSKLDFNVLKSSLRNPHKIIFQIAWQQLKTIDKYLKQRTEKGIELLSAMKEDNITENYKDLDFNKYQSSFVKFYIFNLKFKVPKHIEQLNNDGIEAKHLEHKYQTYYQIRLDNNELLYDRSLESCSNYFSVHDSLISLPLIENINKKQIRNIKNSLKNILQDK